jgi:hypothetical protein
MPRNDWNTASAHSRKPHHKAMNSAAHGKGHDRKIKAARNRPDLGYGHRPVTRHRRRESED